MIEIRLGDYIEIPAWHTEGQVVALYMPLRGSDKAQHILLQSHPEGKTTHYHLEPDEYNFI